MNRKSPGGATEFDEKLGGGRPSGAKDNGTIPIRGFSPPALLGRPYGTCVVTNGLGSLPDSRPWPIHVIEPWLTHVTEWLLSMASTFTKLLYHLVYSTKHRRPLIALTWRDDLYAYIGGIIKERDGIPLEIGGMPDHIHILTKLSPKLAIMDVLRDIKAVSSKWLNEGHRSNCRFEWQVGYGAFSVSHSQVKSVREYIRNQETHHREMTFRAEFVSLLKRHEIEFDPKYVFEEEHVA